MIRILIVAWLGLAACYETSAQDTTNAWRFPTTLGGSIPTTLDSLATHVFADPAALPQEVWQAMEPFQVVDANLQDVFYALASRYHLNIAVDESIQRTVTMRLGAMPVLNALVRICWEQGLVLERNGTVFLIRQLEAPLEPAPPETALPADLPAPEEQVEPEPTPPPVSVRDGLLTAHLAGEDVRVFATTLAAQGPYSIVVREGLTGSITGSLVDVPLAEGLKILFENNGLGLREEGGVYIIDYPQAPPQPPAYEPATLGPSAMGVIVQGGLISVDVVNMSVLDVIREIARVGALSIVTHTSPDGYPPPPLVTARWSGLTLAQALNVLLRGTNLVYRLEGDVLVVGDRQLTGLTTSHLIRLQHIPADRVVERLPDYLRQNATFQMIEEQNGFIVTGPSDVIAQTEAFVREIDARTPQILLEVLVVEFETTELKELGVTFLGGLLPPEANLPVVEGGWKTYLFGGGPDQGGPFDILGDATTGNKFINFWTDLLGISSIGRLPSDFYFRLQALDREGKAHVRSRPQVVTLNGQKASISVGTNQYYILKSAFQVQPGLISSGETERFERIEANVRLEITPWLTASGVITAEIHPTFASPVGVLDPRIPPTINTWDVNTVVELKEGETLLIGGLIQEKEAVTYNKVPLLGSIPLLGRLFRNSRRDTRTSELVIFLTPHVFTGDPEDKAKWDRLLREMKLQSLKRPAQDEDAQQR